MVYWLKDGPELPTGKHAMRIVIDSKQLTQLYSVFWIRLAQAIDHFVYRVVCMCYPPAAIRTGKTHHIATFIIVRLLVYEVLQILALYTWLGTRLAFNVKKFFEGFLVRDKAAKASSDHSLDAFMDYEKTLGEVCDTIYKHQLKDQLH